MTYFLGTLLVIYAMSVLSLIWHIMRTAALVQPPATVAAIDDSTAGALPPIDIVVPVKDEEHNIINCLKSIVAERYPNANVIVVNDRSTDGTPQAVARFQADHPEVHRVDIKELPEGKYGKPHAVHQVAPLLKGEYIFFVDSDILLKPGCLRAIAGRMEREKLDWYALYGDPDLTQFWERLLAPIFGAMAYSWYDPRKISDPDWPDAIGSGFMVARRSAYEAIGGHAGVMEQYDEDSALIRNAKRARQKVLFTISPELYKVKLYGSLERTLKGFSRTMIGGLKTFTRFLITINAIQFISLMPIGMLVLFGLLRVFAVPVPFADWWLGLAAAHLVLSNILVRQIYRTAGLPFSTAVLHPLGSIVAIWACARAARDLRKGKPITWRGTSYDSTLMESTLKRIPTNQPHATTPRS